MYQQHFGLSETPFNLTPDTGYFFRYASHCEALNTLVVAIRSGEGFVKVTGEVGTGKTLLCRKLLNELGDDIVTAYIPNPLLSADELREALADELNIEHQRNGDTHTLLKRINQRLIELRANGKQVVLLIDEAQAIPENTLEGLRLLTNLETEKYKLLQVVLIGQPELDALLDRKSIRQLKQRITFSYQIKSIDQGNIDAYVLHRLNVAGYSGPRLFSNSAIRLLARSSSGIPRMINILCHKALMSAYGTGARQVDKQHIQNAIRDTESSSGFSHNRWQTLDFGISACLLAGIGLIYMGVSL